MEILGLSNKFFFFFFFFFFYFQVLATFIFFEAAFGADKYSEALLSLKSEIVDNQNSLSDWLLVPGKDTSGKISACSWSGVSCDKNSTVVTGINISNKLLGGTLPGKQLNVFSELVDLNISYNSFSGELPAEIFALNKLKSLDISRNNLSGRFRHGVSGLANLVVLDAFSNSFSGPLPVELSQLENLKVLNLAGSYFSGPIPSEYGSFKNLQYIHLAGNLLGGNIPPELGKLQTVTHMEIGYNSYQGSIPWQLGNMSGIEYLDIADANLSGPIPKEFSNLTKLHSLFLFKNQLTGMIPSEFSNIISLASLDLSDNLLYGPIPESFAALKNLKLLSLMYNDMNGTVPDGIAELPSLESLHIWNNHFSGSLPRGLGRNRKLKWLDVSTNNLVGEIPPDICSGGLLKLILFSNSFTGSLSTALSNCSSLVRLRVEDNLFTGEIPLEFDLIPDISYIDLSRNNFTGGIPSMKRASKLEYFNVSRNTGLGGVVPDETWSLPALQNFSASYCNISGTIPPFDSCNSVSVIELNGNSLSGHLPGSISNCKLLEMVDLANNNLTGHLPEELASLPALTVLDLSHNNLTGPIPDKFGDSSSLRLLNVSFNDISGLIPSKKVFQLMGASAFLGNTKLCGTPLRRCPGSAAILGSKGSRKLILVLLLCAGIVFSITMLALGIFYFRKVSKGQWKMIAFNGLPGFTANDVLRSLSSAESKEVAQSLPPSVAKTVLPTGITVLVKKIEWDAKRMTILSEFIMQMGNARHANLIRLLGFCYNKHMAYLLYDYLPNGNLAEKIQVKRDWATKYRVVMGIARGLCFLHHDCLPAIPHGDLKSTNVVFDENMEPHLMEFGFKYLDWLLQGVLPSTASKKESGRFHNAIKEQLDLDVYNFGEIILEILSNGRLKNAGNIVQNRPRDVLLREICSENEDGSPDSVQEEIKLVLDVALLCTRSRTTDRPSIADALKNLSCLKSQKK